MPETTIVNIDGLSRAAVTYSNTLRELPYFDFNAVAKALRLNILKVKGKHTEVSLRRRADLLRPYIAGLTLGDKKELLKFFEASLQPELVYAEINDNITNYKEKNVISNQGEMLDNKRKKHPLELLILINVVRSFNEDVIFNLFFAERDTTVASAATSFTGFFPKMDLLYAAGEISSAKGNYRATGAFNTSGTPGVGSDGKNNYTRLVEFVKSGHPMLRQGELLLQASEKPIAAARDGFQEIVKSFDYPSVEQMLEKLRSDANAPGLKLTTHECLGTGDKLSLMKPGLLDLGVGDEGDKDFVQVRNPYKDPNEVQYWIQAAFDTRIKDVHPKVFQTNEQVNTSVNLAGDYTTTEEAEA